MKIVVIGCTHAGTAAILNCVKLYPDAEITVYEKNDNISFLSCGIALHVGGIVEDPEKLFYCSPQKLASLGVHTRMSHEVLEVDLDKKRLWVRHLESGDKFEDSFDKLIITTGSWPIMPAVDGANLGNIVLAKNYYHSQALIQKSKNADKIAIAGAGYIGIELAEAFETRGKKVTLIDGESRILSKYLDSEFTALIEKELSDRSIRLALGETVSSFRGTDGKVSAVVTSRGDYEADLVIVCIGFRPNTALFSDQLTMLTNGAIVVDEYMRTSHEDVFAAGDSCAVIYNPTGTHEYIPLATNAVRMGTLAARNLVKPAARYPGTQGTSGIRIYEQNIAATGLTESAAAARGISAAAVTVEDSYRPEFMPTYDAARLKVVYDKHSRRLLGAQVMSEADLTQLMNTMSVCIQNRMTIDQLTFVDFFFQPHYNKPWNLLNMAGLNAE